MTATTACANDVPTRSEADQACDDALVIDLVTRARGGDKRAWDALVERYAPLIWSICRKHRLGRHDADDVGQSVWMRLVDHLDKIRDPAALAGWLATTTQRECRRLVRAAYAPGAVTRELDAAIIPDERAGAVEQQLLAAERHAALREAFTCLPLEGQRLIAMLIADPPVTYVPPNTSYQDDLAPRLPGHSVPGIHNPWPARSRSTVTPVLAGRPGRPAQGRR